jgi:putative membrane-bound dehydrogenase-like protein
MHWWKHVRLTWTFLVLAQQVAISAAGDDDVGAADAPLLPQHAAETMLVPDGFQVTLFAGEPDVRQPIAFCIDDRGRLWVAEAYNYPNHTTDPGDRILILEDTDLDGRFDKRTVFYDQLNYVTGIEVGFGGAWVMSPPYFYFIADKDGDDSPDGAPQVLLDGFGTHANAHNLANGFAWGPDGWLYGTHGRTNWSMIATPGTPEKQRIRFDGGVWRYHPVRHEWESFADGTTNPWGIDWDDYGQAFICNCVNPHLFHAIQGAHFEPWRNRESSQYAYERIPTIADHLHFVGTGNVRDGLGSHAEDLAGGGHAHCGTMVYLGDNWPQRYRNTIFMNNTHGRRINNDILERSGSGYTASHGADVMASLDPWFMGVTLTYGFDGSVFVSDWSDTGECHSVRNTRRHTGRIYRISYGDPQTRPVSIAALSDDELVDLHLHRNDRYVRHARRVLQERAAAGEDMGRVHARLYEMFASNQDVTRSLRGLWTLHATGGLSDEFLIDQLGHQDEHIRAWSVRLLCEDQDPPDRAVQKFVQLARQGDSPLVRLHLASALQRLAEKHRWVVAEALTTRADDARDPNVPLMLWYGVEPLIADDLPRYAALAGTAQIPLISRNIARRIVSGSYVDEGLPLMLNELARASDAVGEMLLQGMLTGLEGRRSYPMPDNWTQAYDVLGRSNRPTIRDQSMRLALIFDDQNAIDSLRVQAADASATAMDRTQALDALVARKIVGLGPMLLRLLADSATQQSALRGLAEYNHPGTAEAILSAYDRLDEPARPQAIQTLASRENWATALLDAIESDQIPRSDVSAFAARQLQNLGIPEISDRLRRLWGEVRESDAERRRTIDRLKRQLSPDALAGADLKAGHILFQKQCANCHRFFGEGGTIGPDITGAQRTNMDYLLENLVDPSAAVSRDFQMEVVQTTAGRVITGLVAAETDRVLIIRTVTERIVIPTDEIEDRVTSPVSMMPEGLLKPLTNEEIRDLFGYLCHTEVPPSPEQLLRTDGNSDPPRSGDDSEQSPPAAK